ncbi:L-fucose isomerase-like protein [Salsuginibacillus halophilus]|uniref:L-fucose isomerase-like protein n=1 Tax=Salsuginibacillus halophilus TaxID=517424 RepID=A0A2P8HKY6_9BACI|nr:hypothetical protein [Salsuginibacillus halophilus]PSL46887.1 L-fucose isomerase-like protein [Salsuginibacillus halophilus]
MKEPAVLYIPVGRKTFDMEAAEAYWEETKVLLQEECPRLVQPEGILTSPEELETFLKSVAEEIGLIIYQSVTFADGEFIYTITQHSQAPVLVWSVREPSINGRLRLNSLTGGNSTSHVLQTARHPYSFVFGNPEEAHVRKTIRKTAGVQNVIAKLKQLNVGVIGEHQPGFYFSGTDEAYLQEELGVNVEHIDLQAAFDASKELTEPEYAPLIEEADQHVIGLKRDDHTVQRFAQFSSHVRSLVQDKDIHALAIRCWPEFFNELGAAACSTLSHFTEQGTVSACESDIHGSVSMFILQEISGGSAPYLGDMVHVNEASNSVVFWHCGAGAYSLAHPSQGAVPGVHPNRKLGFAMDFGLKPGKVTMFRLGYTPDGFRLLIMRGEALDTPKRFQGTSVEVALETDVTDTVQTLMEAGYEPHYGLVYEDVVDELIELGRQLDLPTDVLTHG